MDDDSYRKGVAKRLLQVFFSTSSKVAIRVPVGVHQEIGTMKKVCIEIAIFMFSA